MADPFAVQCPKCGAKPRCSCKTPTGYNARTHVPRWAAIGIPHPTLDQRLTEYSLICKHESDRISEAYEARRLRNLALTAGKCDA